MRDLDAIGKEIDRIRNEILSCERCEMKKIGKPPEYGVSVPGIGPPTARLMLIGEAPGKDEALQGKPFVGKAGQLLRAKVNSTGIDPNLIYVCNVVHCRPLNNDFSTVQLHMVEACHWMKEQIKIIKPLIVIGLGAKPWKFLLKENRIFTLNCGEFREMSVDDVSFLYMPTLHPSFCLRDGNPNSNNPVMAMTAIEKQELMSKHIEESVKKLMELIKDEQNRSGK